MGLYIRKVRIRKSNSREIVASGKRRQTSDQDDIEMRTVIVVFAAFLAFGTTDAKDTEKKVVCYLNNSALHRPLLGKFEISRVDPHLCTHLIYTHIGLTDHGDVLDPATNSTNDTSYQVARLRLQNNALKVLVSLDGWNQGSEKLSKIVSDPELSFNLVENIVKFCKHNYNFHGLDLVWRLSAQRDGQQQDMENFVRFLQDLRKRFDSENLILSVSVPASEILASTSYNIAAMSKYPHFINLQAYNYRGCWDKKTGAHAPLYAGSWETGFDRQLNVNASVNYWIAAGAPPEKLVLGIPFFGNSFTLDNKIENVIGAPASRVGIAGQYSGVSGTLGFNEICELQLLNKWNVFFDNEQRVPYAVHGQQWISYENVESVKEKARYIQDHNLGGAGVWTIDSDDFRGICGPKYSLLRALNEVFHLPKQPGKDQTSVGDSPSNSSPLHDECRGNIRDEKPQFQGNQDDKSIGDRFDHKTSEFNGKQKPNPNFSGKQNQRPRNDGNVDSDNETTTKQDVSSGCSLEFEGKQKGASNDVNVPGINEKPEIDENNSYDNKIPKYEHTPDISVISSSASESGIPGIDDHHGAGIVHLPNENRKPTPIPPQRPQLTEIDEDQEIEIPDEQFGSGTIYVTVDGNQGKTGTSTISNNNNYNKPTVNNAKPGFGLVPGNSGTHPGKPTKHPQITVKPGKFDSGVSPVHDTNNHPSQTQPGQFYPDQSHPYEIQPGQFYPGQTQPGQSYPGPNQYGHTQPGQSYPDQIHLCQIQHGQSYPGQTQPGESYPDQSHPCQTQPGQSSPGHTQPGQSYPGQTRPNQVFPGQVNPESRPNYSPWNQNNPGHTQKDQTCYREGYIRDPHDCSIFYYCKKSGNRYDKFKYNCPGTLFFDEKSSVCNWPYNVPECLQTNSKPKPLSNTITPSRPVYDVCKHPGYTRDPHDCSIFYNCEASGNGYRTHKFNCPANLFFDLTNLTCNWPHNVPECH